MKAGDLIKQLMQDPEYVKQLQREEEEHQKKMAEIKASETPFIEDLYANGFPEIESTNDLLKLKKVSNKLTKLLLKWIPLIDNKHHYQEMLVRGLIGAEKSFDGTLLINLFDDKKSEFNLKWAIANTIASTDVQNISSWLENKLAASEQPKENEMLVYAAIKYFPYAQASDILRRLFDTFPLQASGALAYIGKQKDLEFLEEKSHHYKGPLRTQINKTIKVLKKKIE